jgi:hypothetical protein
MYYVAHIRILPFFNCWSFVRKRNALQMVRWATRVEVGGFIYGPDAIPLWA